MVVSLKLNWGCAFENFMSCAERMTYQFLPKYDEYKMLFLDVKRVKTA